MRLSCKCLFSALLILISLTYTQVPDTLWTKTYGGEDHESGFDAMQTADSGYIVVGYTESFGVGGADIWLLKTDANGDTMWTKTYGGDYGWSVRQTVDGGYIIAGTASRPFMQKTDVYLIRTDSLGDTLWTRFYGGQSHELCHSVIETSDSGFAFVWSIMTADWQMRLTKLDSSGGWLWLQDYGVGMGYSLQQTSDEGYIITGRRNDDVIIVKTDSLGYTIWTKVYGGDFDCGWSIQQIPDDGYIVTGDKGDDIFLMKTDIQGDSLWTKTFGGDSSDAGRSVGLISDGGYIIAGYTNSFGAGNSDVYLIRTDNNGDTIWTRVFGGTDSDGGWQVQQLFDGNYIIAGYTASFGAGNYDVWLLKVGTEVDVEEENAVIEKNSYGATIVSGPLLLPEGKKCNIYDITGRTVAPDKMKPGIYFIEVDGVVTQKIVKVR